MPLASTAACRRRSRSRHDHPGHDHPGHDHPGHDHPGLPCENPLYHFKGARSAPGRGDLRTCKSPRDGGAGCRTAQDPRVAGWPPGDRDAPGRRLPSFGPPGHVGACAHSTPRGRPHRLLAATSALARGAAKAAPSLRRPHSEALRAHGQERSLRSRGCAIPSGLWTAARAGIQGAPVGGMASSERWLPL